jgi:hypothetical protein
MVTIPQTPPWRGVLAAFTSSTGKPPTFFSTAIPSLLDDGAFSSISHHAKGKACSHAPAYTRRDVANLMPSKGSWAESSKAFHAADVMGITNGQHSMARRMWLQPS